MAMVRQLTGDELMNGSTPEEDSHSSDPLDSCNHSASHSSSGSKRNSPVYMPSRQYSKEDLMKYATLPLSQNRPSYLDPAFNNTAGKWDPERWFMNHRGDRVPSGEEPRSKRERQEDGIVSHKRKSSDPKERIKEEKDDIVLSPQRRSFGTGCHVIQQSSLARRPGSPTDGRDAENFRDPGRRIGSGRIMTRDRDSRDWDRDREYGYNSGRTERRDRFEQDEEKDIRRYSNRFNRNDRRSRGRDRIDEVEPEWFSGGPTSQSETIELVGFEENQNDDNRKQTKKSKRAKQNSRRSSLKSEEGEKVMEQVMAEELPLQKKANLSQEEIKPSDARNEAEVPETNKSNNTGFDLDDLFRMDWIPGLLQNESPPDNAGSKMGGSRFSQWFKRESPQPESGNNSRRSSLHEELIANVLNSIVEPQLIIPSPTPNSSDTFFAPISPALSHSNYSSSLAPGCNSSKGIMDMLQSAKANSEATINGGNQKDPQSVKELEADLKRIVLGENKDHQERSAFDKLLQHMSDSRNSPASSLSIGPPLDKSKALQEQDLLQDMLGDSHTSSISPGMQHFQMFKDDKHISQHPSGLSRNQFTHSHSNQNDLFTHLMQQHHPKQQEQHLSHVQQMQLQQQQIQNHLQQQQQQQQHHHHQSQHMNVHGYTVDMLAKIFGSSQPPVSPASPGLHQSASAPSLGQNDPMNSVLQYRQQELLSSILKQQQQHSGQNVSQSSLLQQQQRRQRPSTKDIPIQQTLGLPTLGISPRQSPLPPDAVNSAISSQGRIPSPLVFGQQPPALSHAPAPIHPAALVQAMAQQNATNSNTLQVQNPVVLQRVPSPQELAVHTQSILQNALIKRKLEEQKENFRKRQEAQRTNSPVASNKNGMTVSPLKGLSPTIAFTPTSVMRKIQSDKTEIKEQKNMTVQNGSDSKLDSNHKMNVMGNVPSSLDCGMSTVNSGSHIPCSQNTGSLGQAAPRALHGQSNAQPRSIHGSMNSVGSSITIPNQGRPIVKVGMNQNLNSSTELNRTSINKAAINHNKQFLSSSGQAHSLHHDAEPGFDPMAKFPWQHQLARPPNPPALPQLQMAATYAALNRPAALNPHHPSLLRPGNVAASNINFPLMRNPVQNPIRAQTSTINNLGLSLQFQQRAIDSRQLQALAQSQRFHPATIQQLLMNSQNPMSAAAQAQVVAGNRVSVDKHQHLLPGQSSTNRQSPVNLAKWFGSDVLKQKMPEMPPMTHQKALLVEEVERQQQQSTAVHN